MSITHCPTCEEPLRQFPSCGQCVNPYCNDYTEHPRLSPLPVHQDLDASLAAPAQVDQVGGTTDIYQDFFSSISALFSLSASHRYGSLEHRALMDGIAALRIVLSERGFPDELVFAHPERCA